MERIPSVDEPGVIATSSSLWSDVEREQVLEQLNALLASSLFRQSRRYPAFLRFVVEETLRGADGELKERTIGIEVFGRQPSYDTSLDPTVRLTAAEVRKRLTQYYQLPENAGKLHIELHPGSYVPGFSWPNRVEEAVVPASKLGASAIVPASATEAADPVATTKAWAFFVDRPWYLRGFLLVAALVLILFVSFAVYRRAAATNRTDIWLPIRSSSSPVTLVLADVSKTDLLPSAGETSATSVLVHIRDNRLVDFNDSVALGRLAGTLGGWSHPYNTLLSSETNFADLQRGPTILIGAVDNPWTMRFLESMPYSVSRREKSMTFAIVGNHKAADPTWSIDLSQPFAALQQDYGIIARQMDTMTGKPVLIVAGLGQNGTTAGIQLLTDPALARATTADAPKGWPGRNLEIVFRTQIINDRFGPATIVAREYW